MNRTLGNANAGQPEADIRTAGTSARGSDRGGPRRNLLALGSAAVMTVYAVGFARTQEAALQLASQSASRRRPAPEEPATPSAGRSEDERAQPQVDSVAPAVVTTDGGLPTPVATAPPDGSPEKVLDAALANGTPTAAALSQQPTLVVSGGSATVSDVAASKSNGTSAGTSLDSAMVPSAPSAGSTPVAASPTTAPSTAIPPSAAGATTTAPGQSATTPATTTTTASSAAPAAAPAPAKVVWRDGFFFGRGTSRHGDIEAMVEIKDGRIMSSVISQCLTRYSCSWIERLPGQVVTRQSADVDYVSGATESANAFYYAIVQALKQAK